MNCPICDGSDFVRLDNVHAQSIMLVCSACGFLGHEVDPTKEAAMKDYYRKNYRKHINHMNLITCNQKVQYFDLFMADWLKDKKGLVCGDVGSAIGYIPNLMRGRGHRATGCELTPSMRRFSEHFYGIPLTEELDPNHHYDLITINHVLEHLMEPDKKLAHYASLLKDEGVIYVSIPEWLNVLAISAGNTVSSTDEYFHKDHINCFTRRSVQNLFAKCGLEIIKEDHIMYGQTYLLKKGEVKEFVPESPADVEKKVADIKIAIELHLSKKQLDAIAIWPRYPEAWIQYIMDDCAKQLEKQEEAFGKVADILPDDVQIRSARGIWNYQREEFNKALEDFAWIDAHKPNADTLVHIGWCMSHLEQPQKAIAAYSQACELNPMKWRECMDFICQQAVKIPHFEERAMVAAMQASGAKGNG